MQFSIIIPLYNKQNFVKRAVESVIIQNYKNFELIIVNDGSKDDSLKVVEKIKDDRIIIVSQSNKGVSSARNLGIDLAKNEWICFLDADDFWLPNHLETIGYLINKYPDGKIYSTISRENSSRGLRVIPNALGNDFEGYLDDYFKYAQTSTIFNSSSVCINKISLLSVGKFDVNITHGEDLDVWFKIIIRFKGVVKS
jgi:glycosyltransferase involved in cell wall biosynthesis